MLSSAIVSIVLLAAAAVLLAGLFQAALERNFDARLRAVLDGLLANVDIAPSTIRFEITRGHRRSCATRSTTSMAHASQGQRARTV